MANKEQLDRLQASLSENNGCAVWNQWRKDDWDAETLEYRTYINFRGADLSGANLGNTDLSGVTLSGANLINADLGGANLTNIYLIGADLTGAHLTDTNLRRAHLSDALLLNVSLNRANLADAHLSRTDLSYASLVDADLSRANLTGALLVGVDCHDSDLAGVNLNRANLTQANLIGVDFTGADLSEADFTDADLSRAILIRTNFTGARLNGANFSNVYFGDTHFADIDTRSVVGLDTVNHQGSSTIGSDTFYQSHGEVPDTFLRGCGIPDEMIGFVHSIAGAIQYYSAFISYNHQDEAFAAQLYHDLQAKNVRCWKYTENIRTGDDIFDHVDKAIRLHDKLLVIFSLSSIESEWVRDEVDAALEREKREGKQILFPVMIDEQIKTTDQFWIARIRRKRSITDFTAWKDAYQYQLQFDRLLRDLEAGEH